MHSVKYLHKYIYKGGDHGQAGIQIVDEIAQYLSGRYLSFSEACWRIFNFSLHSMSPNVYWLPAHLEGANKITFTPNADLSTLPARVDQRYMTELT